MSVFDEDLIGIATPPVVNDIDTRARLFRTIFGFDSIEKMEGPDLLKNDNSVFRPATGNPPENTDDATNVNSVLRTGDCRTVFNEFHGKGMQFFSQPQTPPWEEGGRRCFTRHPDGSLIEIEQTG